MVPVQLLLSLAASEQWIRHIDYDALVTVVIVIVSIAWLMLTSDILRNQHRHSTNWHSLSVEQMVGAPLIVYSNIRTLWIALRINSIHCKIVQFVWHLLKIVPDIGVKGNSSGFLFDFEIGCSHR